MDNRGKRLFVKSNVMIGMILSCFGEVLGHFKFQCSSIYLLLSFLLLLLCWVPAISSWFCCGCSGVLSWIVPE